MDAWLAVIVSALIQAAGPIEDPPEHCLALNIYHEARGEPIPDRVAAAQVVMERTGHIGFPSDPCSVVNDYRVSRDLSNPPFTCAFSWRCDCISDEPLNSQAWADAQLIASAVLAGSGHAEFEATHYHARRISPWWASGLVRIGRYGGEHIYYGGG